MGFKKPTVLVVSIEAGRIDNADELLESFLEAGHGDRHGDRIVVRQRYWEMPSFIDDEWWYFLWLEAFIDDKYDGEIW